MHQIKKLRISLQLQTVCSVIDIRLCINIPIVITCSGFRFDNNIILYDGSTPNNSLYLIDCARCDQLPKIA